MKEKRVKKMKGLRYINKGIINTIIFNKYLYYKNINNYKKIFIHNERIHGLKNIWGNFK